MLSYRVKLVAYRIASNIPISPSSIGQMHLCVGWALAIDLAHHPAKVHFFCGTHSRRNSRGGNGNEYHQKNSHRTKGDPQQASQLLESRREQDD